MYEIFISEEGIFIYYTDEKGYRRLIPPSHIHFLEAPEPKQPQKLSDQLTLWPT